MMERALKERIIGAIVLVAVVVLVVPVFLDGPPENDEIVSERVLLPGQDEQPSQTIVLERNRTEPVPAQTAPELDNEPAAEAENPRPEPDRTEPKPVAAKPVTVASTRPTSAAVAAAPKAEKPTSDATRPIESTTGMWAVQLGSFSNQQNAEQLAADLRKQGFAAFLSQLDATSGQLHRVRVGPQKDRAAAEAMVARLKKAGHDGKVLPHP